MTGSGKVTCFPDSISSGSRNTSGNPEPSWWEEAAQHISCIRLLLFWFGWGDGWPWTGAEFALLSLCVICCPGNTRESQTE